MSSDVSQLLGPEGRDILRSLTRAKFLRYGVVPSGVDCVKIVKVKFNILVGSYIFAQLD